MAAATPVYNDNGYVTVCEGTRVNLRRAYEDVPVGAAHHAFTLNAHSVLVDRYQFLVCDDFKAFL